MKAGNGSRRTDATETMRMDNGCLKETEPIKDAPPELADVISDHQGPLLRYVTQFLWPDKEGSQDVVQTTFIRYHRQTQKRPDRLPDNVRAWLFTVARNLSLDALRRRRRRQRLEHEVAEESESRGLKLVADDFKQMERQEIYERALAELDKLPDDQREVLLLKHVEGLTLREISEITGMKLSAVHYRITDRKSVV